jgi:ring-1,2-phenylacetyl-CoA epoxidase subunit PaaD
MNDLSERINTAVRAVSDPELAGVSIGDLGLIRSIEVFASGSVAVVLVPTFLGCPALQVIQRDVRSAAQSTGATHVTVRFDYSVPWTTNSVSQAGRQILASYGIAVATGDRCACPYCDSDSLRELSPVGPAACRSAYWCESCRSSVEVFRDSHPREVRLKIPRSRLSPPTETTHAHV